MLLSVFGIELSVSTLHMLRSFWEKVHPDLIVFLFGAVQVAAEVEDGSPAESFLCQEQGALCTEGILLRFEQRRMKRNVYIGQRDT